ncbi:efflux RND transporter periplasmic adaptor subunit [Candidatus Magnetaquicoccus inordinatus]|uniref:efflux RND transporter periplasmic adaptor subunit n=1 Tax=Candidatus Magnetaquicoccus inordinatus TaxID=2496818 RepID=UPI00102C7137|nr:HlyD family efflux transporter periplasmic adaptor subunit [Candidatus Magnetaquicoccus inordinatus]
MSHSIGRTGRILVPLLSLTGMAMMIYAVVAGDETLPVAPPAAQPAASPYASTVAGAGLIEASSRNIALASPLPGIVQQIAVQPGQRVAAGELLFQLDERQIVAEIAVRKAALQVAESRLVEAQAAAIESRFLLQQVKGLSDNRAVSREEVQKRESADAVARARVNSSEAALRQAHAEVQAAETERERLHIRAPLAGEVLQVNIRPGELLSASNSAVAAVVLGETSLLHVRVDIDESDAWRLPHGGKATARLRGNAALQIPLQWVRVEPLVIPKQSLTGNSTERVDTRVLQVIFSFERGKLPVYVGQQLDVFIDAASAGGAGQS